ncbi:MAG TPA: hypothetical protein VGF09_02065 [Solirubrobacterales bacterium]
MAACIVVVAFLAWRLFPRDNTTHVSVGEAVNQFRAEGGGKGGGEGALFEREPGVYRYRTSGSESADTGLISATHDYDGISTITISPKGCGVVERWEVLGGRWSEFTSCPTKGGDFFELTGLVEYHEFFGENRRSTYTCTGDPASKRSARQVGKTFQGRCESDEGDTATSSTLVDAIEKIDVGGQPFDAVHTSSQVKLEGHVSGTAKREDWRRRSDGLLLKRVSSSDAHMSGTIDADYHESYSIHLLSVIPRQ